MIKITKFKISKMRIQIMNKMLKILLIINKFNKIKISKIMNNN